MAAKVVKLAMVETKYDPIFFPRQAIKRGTKMVNYGRRDEGSLWTVTNIRTYVRKPSGMYHLEPTREVKHLSDIITLTREPDENGDVYEREPTFGSLSYSAIWRLA